MDAGFVEILSTISSMASTTKSIADAARAIKAKARAAPEVDRAISEVLDQAISLQSRQIDLQTAILRLQAENAELAEKLRAYQVRASVKNLYQLQKVGRSWVMRPEVGPDVYCCPSCMETDGHEIVLQRHPETSISRGSPSDICPKCKTAYYLD